MIKRIFSLVYVLCPLPGIEDDDGGLEQDEDDGEEAVDGVDHVQAVRVQVQDEVGRELEEVVAEAPQPEHHRALPQEPAPVRPHVVVGGGSGLVTRDS